MKSNPEYDSGTFPISEVFEELTVSIREEQTEPLRALYDFEGVMQRRNLSHVRDYASTAITTGGHARIEGLDMGQVITANTVTAREVIVQLHRSGAVLGSEVILPVDLGNTGWDQFQFMEFWTMLIGGYDIRSQARRPGGLRQLERAMQQAYAEYDLDLETMANRTLDREIRRPEYMKFARAIGSLVLQSDDPTPVRRFLSVVDTGLSLGSDAERELAQMLDIPLFRVAAVKPAGINDLSVPTLKNSLSVIQANGGETLIATKGSMLTVVPADIEVSDKFLVRS